MKAEINNENKAKFFALYWGQEVMCFNDEGQYKKGDCYEVQGDLDDHNFLELKPLSQISDEDAIEVIGAKEVYLRQNQNNGSSGYFGMSPSGIFCDSLRVDTSYHIGLNEADYLRSKGYALPWMGLSVEEMVEAGWIKIREEDSNV